MKNISKIGFLFLITSLLLVSIASAGVEYDSDLLRAFDNRVYAEWLMIDENFVGFEITDDKIWAKVIVRLKDNSGIGIVGTKEERRNLLKQRDEWFKPKIDEVLNTISKLDIKKIQKLSTGFGALITKEGFEKLIKNNNVKKVIWSTTPPPKAFLENKLHRSLIIVLILLTSFILLIVIYLILKKRANKKR